MTKYNPSFDDFCKMGNSLKAIRQSITDFEIDSSKSIGKTKVKDCYDILVRITSLQNKLEALMFETCPKESHGGVFFGPILSEDPVERVNQIANSKPVAIEEETNRCTYD